MNLDGFQFIVPASDRQGHSEHEQFRMPKDMVTQALKIIASRRYPWLTLSDLYRAAIWNVVKELVNQSGGEIKSSIPMIEAAIGVVNRENERRRFRETIEAIHNEAMALVSGGDMPQARALYYEIRDIASKIPSEYWKHKYIREIDSRLGHLGGPRGVSLKPSEMEMDE